MQAEWTGQILANRYLLEREIGRGGMGAVYRSTDLRTGGTVAVKFLHPIYAGNAEFVERLRREAQIAASLSSPQIVRVIDLDQVSGTPFLVMEYVEGETLHDRLQRQGPLPIEEVLHVAIDMTKALEAAHRRGIVHRDLKPQNVKLVDGEIKVLDFGIAKAEGLQGLTAVDMFVGTPEYCAPERLDGRGDIRSDIYAIGVIMHEMLTGAPPFSAPTAMSVMRKHERDAPPPLPSGTPPAVAAIVLKAMEKDPDARQQTPAELLAELNAALRAQLAASHAAAAATVPMPAAARSEPNDADAAGFAARPEADAASARASGGQGPLPPAPPPPDLGDADALGGAHRRAPAEPVTPLAPTATAKRGGPLKAILIGVGLGAIGIFALLLVVGLLAGGEDEVAGGDDDPAPAAAPTTAAGALPPSPAATATVVAAPPVVAPTEPAAADVILRDDFSDPSRTATQVRVSDPATATGETRDGVYLLRRSDLTGRALPAIALGPYANASLAVDARLADPEGRFLTLLCRYDSNAGHYQFYVDPTSRQFALTRFDSQGPSGPTATNLVPWSPSPAIRGGSEPNRLELTCAGDTISASVNGTQVASLRDGRYATGRWYAGAGTMENRPGAVDARLDNLLVTRR